MNAHFAEIVSNVLIVVNYSDTNFRVVRKIDSIRPTCIRTANPIESTLSTIWHRTKRSRGCLSRRRMLCMMSELGLYAERRWRRLSGFRKLGKVVEGMQFKDGIEVKNLNDQMAA